MIKFFKTPLLRNVAFAAAALLVAGTAATPALADGFHGHGGGGHFAGGHFNGGRGGFGGYGYGRGFDHRFGFGGYWGPRFYGYGPAYVYPPAVYAPGVSVWVR
jgi:hypothetical protein